MDEDHHFCLRWNNHQSTITSVFATLFENEKLVDCTLAAEGKSIKAHKVVLAACSPYFATLLSQQYDKQPIFILKDVKYQELQAMVNYMYFGEVSISQEHLAGLLRAAESLEIIGLSDNRARNQQKHIFDEQQHKHTNLPDKLSVKSAAADKNTLQTKPSRIGKSSTASQNVYNQERSPVSTLRRRKIARRRINDNILPNNQGSSSPPEVIKALTSSTTNSTTAVLPIFDNRVAGIVPRITENILTDNHCSFSLPEVIQAGTSSLSAKNSIETITSRLPIVSTGVAGTLPRSTKNNLVGNQDSLSSSGVIQTGTTSATNSTGTITTVLPIAGNSFAGTVPINTGIIASSFLAVPSLQQQQTSDTTRPENTTTANRNKKIETEKMGTTDQMKTSTSLDLTNFDVKNAEVEENKETYLNRPTYLQHEGGTTSATGKAEILLKSENDDEDLEDSDNNHGPSQGDEKFAQWKEDKTHQRDPKDMSLDCEQSMTTNSGRLPCNVCGKSYLRKRHLQRHMRDECIGIPPRFKCDLCPARFRRNYHMVRHMTSKHGIPSIDGPENLSMKRIYYENKYFPESGKYATSKADKTALADVNTTNPEPVPANNTAPSAYSGSDEENKQQNNIAQEEETTPISIKTEPISPSKLTLPMDEDWKMKLRFFETNILIDLRFKIGSGQSHSLCYGGGTMVNGYSRSSQTRKDKRKSKEYTFNYVDRVRLGQSSLQKQYHPPCGSGWRQKSISNLDLSTNRHSSSYYIEDDRRLRPSRSLDYKHTTHKDDTLDIAEFYWRIDPDKDYENIQHNNYVDESGYHSTNLYNQPYDIGNESCSLRRSRSLAVIREETFSDLQISSANSNRRSQLIPRARLVNRGFFEERFTGSRQPTYYHHHHHQYHQHHHHQSSTLDRPLAIPGETPQSPAILVAPPPETTTIIRESDEYYENLKRLDAHQQSIWQNEKSDLESLNSEYFRNSHHQSDSTCGGGGGTGGGRESSEKQRLYQSHNHKSTLHRKYSSHLCGEESCPELSQSSVFPETTTTSNSDDQSDSLTISEQEYDIERVEEILSKVYNEKFEVISLTEEQNQKRSQNTDEQGALIAYDSVYLSSEESSEGTIVEEKPESASLLHISIEDIYDPPEKPEVIEEKSIENPLYSQVLRVPPVNSAKVVDSKPKILALVEKKKLKRLSDYAVVPKREPNHLTYISTHSSNYQLIDDQYYSLPDVNIGKSLKVSERIDAKLRSSYNLKEESVISKTTESTIIYDSIKRFGRAHKKVRQRENEFQDICRSEPDKGKDKEKQRETETEEDIEKPREAPSIQVETYAKEIITIKEKEVADESTPPIELGQFRIIVTDTHNNVIEEDSIDGSISSVPPPPTSLNTEVESANGNHSNQKEHQQQEFEEDKLVEATTNQTKRTICRTPSKPKRLTSNINHSEVCKAKDRRLYGTYRARPIKVKPNDSLRRVGKMSRPQVIQVVDSKKQQQPALSMESKHPLAVKQAEDEFLQKVDAIRCYWSKMSEKTQNKENLEGDAKSKKDFIIGEEVKCLKPTVPVYDEDFQSLMPSIEIVELDGEKHATIVKANADEPVPEFDHIRYKVMKPNLFRSNILNRSKKEAQFDGLIQYLQEYSFQELLTNNNVVIVEPVRTKVERPSKDTQSGVQHQTTKGGQNCKITGGAGNNCNTSVTNTIPNPQPSTDSHSHKKLSKRHFFYQPVRVNRELLEEELPTPDTVRNVRKFFEENVLPNKRGDEQRSALLSPEVATDKQLNNNVGRRTTERLRYLTIDTSYGNMGQVNNNGNVTNPAAGTLRKWDSVSLSSGISSGDLSSPCECSNGVSTVDGRSPSQQTNDNNNERHQEQQEAEVRGGMHVRDFIRRHNACGSQDSNGLCGDYMDGEDVGVAGNDPEEAEDEDEDDMVDDELCESYYVSEDVLEKIRECGSTVTYYGGRVMMHSPPATGATLRIPRSKIEFLTCNSCQPNECPHKDQLHDQLLAQQNYNGIKFKLVKSNSCSSRLELIGTQKLGNNYPDTIGEDDSIDGNTEATNYNDDDEYDVGEPLVRRLVHRLETTGKINGNNNKYTGPRIIESQCIEKVPRRPTSLVVDRKKIEASTAAHKRFSEGFTINNQMVGKSDAVPEPQPYAHLLKQVTVNNHINVPDESPAASACFTSSAMDIRLVEKAGGIEQAKLTNGKIRRNKNVDLAFTMKGPNGTIKNLTSSQKMPDATTENTEKNYRNGSKESKDAGKTFNITEHFDGHLLPKEEVVSAATTGKTPGSSSELIVDKSLVRHYVTNDKRLFSKPKYDDIEFEEFEVYDPLKDATDKAEQLVDGLAEDITRAVSASSSYEMKSSNLDDCYDSLDDKKI